MSSSSSQSGIGQPGMSQSEINRKIVENVYRAALQGDVAGFFSYFSEDLQALEPSFLPYGGRHRGTAGFQALFGQVAQYMKIESLKVESIVADGEAVIAFISLRTVADDSEVQLAERWIVRNGKIVEMKIFVHELGSMTSVIKR